MTIANVRHFDRALLPIAKDIEEHPALYLLVYIKKLLQLLALPLVVFRVEIPQSVVEPYKSYKSDQTQRTLLPTPLNPNLGTNPTLQTHTII